MLTHGGSVALCARLACTYVRITAFGAGSPLNDRRARLMIERIQDGLPPFAGQLNGSFALDTAGQVHQEQ